MHLGIFARTFPRPTPESTLDAVASHDLAYLQWNMACAGLPTLPETFDPDLCDRLALAFSARHLTPVALSGTFNTAHPDPLVRRAGLDALAPLALTAVSLGIPMVTMCTGTRDPHDPWKHHPANPTTAAWSDMLATFARALEIARSYDLILAFEPETGNIVDSAPRARRLLDEFASPHLKVLIDPANLVHGDPSTWPALLSEAFDLLAPDIALAHAKDLTAPGTPHPTPLGAGLLDFPHYLRLLRTLPEPVPLIAHGFPEPDAPASLAYLRQQLATP